MLIIVDIKHFLEMTPAMPDYYRKQILSFWLDRVYGTILPNHLILENDTLETDKVWQVARMLEKEHGGIPLKLPVNILNILSLDLRKQALFIWVDDEEFYQRNPDLCRLKNTSLRYPIRSKYSQKDTKVSGETRLLRRF